jgi:hypothetical protein
MDYSEALILIQAAKDRAGNACRNMEWDDAETFCKMLHEAVESLSREVQVRKRLANNLSRT